MVYKKNYFRDCRYNVKKPYYTHYQNKVIPYKYIYIITMLSSLMVTYDKAIKHFLEKPTFHKEIILPFQGLTISSKIYLILNMATNFII